MVIEAFPPLKTADEDGLIAIGGDVEVESLLLAYRNGIFPWPLQEDLLAWFAPPKRAVLFFKDLRVSRSLRKTLRQERFQVAFEDNFEEIVSQCRRVHSGEKGQGTWITAELLTGYSGLYRAGYISAAGAYAGKQLVGGVYGVLTERYCSAESMFFTEPNASKVALVTWLDFLREQRGLSWIDCQVLNPFTESLGACEISREEFMELIASR